MKSDLQFGSKDMFTECLEIWKDWIHLEMNIDDVALQRKRLMLFGLNLTDNESPDEGQDHVSFHRCNIASQHNNQTVINTNG